MCCTGKVQLQRMPAAPYFLNPCRERRQPVWLVLPTHNMTIFRLHFLALDFTQFSKVSKASTICHRAFTSSLIRKGCILLRYVANVGESQHLAQDKQTLKQLCSHTTNVRRRDEMQARINENTRTHEKLNKLRLNKRSSATTH